EPLEMPKAADASAEARHKKPCIKWSKGQVQGHWHGNGGCDCGGYEIRTGPGPRGGSGYWFLYGPRGAPLGISRSLSAAKAHAQRDAETGNAGVLTYKAQDFDISTRDVEQVRAGRKRGSMRNAKAIYEYVSPDLLLLSQEVVIVVPVDLRGHPLADKPFQ